MALAALLVAVLALAAAALALAVAVTARDEAGTARGDATAAVERAEGAEVVGHVTDALTRRGITLQPGDYRDPTAPPA